MWRVNSLEKPLMLGKTEGKRRRHRQRMRWLDGITTQIHESEQTLGDSEGQGSLVCCSSWVVKSWTWLTNWTTITATSYYYYFKWKRWETKSNRKIFLRKSDHQTKLDFFILNHKCFPYQSCSKIKQSKQTYLWKFTKLGTSLVVQWLRFHAPNAGGLASIPGWGTINSSCILQLRPSSAK